MFQIRATRTPKTMFAKRKSLKPICLSRAGITLLEIVIVMTIIVLLGALAIPSIGRSFSGQKLSKAADLVRNQLNRARVQSMRTGKVHAFFYLNESAQYKVAPFDEEVAKVLSESLNRNNDEYIPTTNIDIGGNRLPRGIQFFDGETVADGRSEATFANEDVSINRNFRPVLFYPDGSSQAARLYLRSDDDEYAEIRLRAMTGSSTSSIVDLRR